MKLTGRWFPQIVDRDSGKLYPIYITKIVVLVSEPVCARSQATELPCSDSTSWYSYKGDEPSAFDFECLRPPF